MSERRITPPLPAEIPKKGPLETSYSLLLPHYDYRNGTTQELEVALGNVKRALFNTLVGTVYFNYRTPTPGFSGERKIKYRINPKTGDIRPIKNGNLEFFLKEDLLAVRRAKARKDEEFARDRARLPKRAS